jgi:hypothetical protein
VLVWMATHPRGFMAPIDRHLLATVKAREKGATRTIWCGRSHL